MRCRWAQLLSSEEAEKFVPGKGQRVRTVKDTMPWNKGTYKIQEFSSFTEALEVNLNIFYTLVDDRRRVNDDAAKNVNIQCWLQFGPIRQVVSDGVLHIEHSHDLRLNCGAATFDEALVKLACKVRRYYGDFPAPKWLRAPGRGCKKGKR